MIYHKIRGIDKNICTAEQKLAYNIAFRISIDARYNWAQDASAAARSAAEHSATADYLLIWTRDHADAARKYNTDAIFCALRAGLHDYLISGAPIATSYDQVGRMFPAYYL